MMVCVVMRITIATLVIHWLDSVDDRLYWLLLMEKLLNVLLGTQA